MSARRCPQFAILLLIGLIVSRNALFVAGLALFRGRFRAKLFFEKLVSEEPHQAFSYNAVSFSTNWGVGANPDSGDTFGHCQRSP